MAGAIAARTAAVPQTVAAASNRNRAELFTGRVPLIDPYRNM
ncbi:hypothetical protein NSERUTF1_5343 [Nocardia seriolae]|nr:hypothetical protein NSERUTF1_5343 [Nocardia seriolae]